MRPRLSQAIRLDERRARRLVWTIAALAALGFALPTFWWAAVNVDEELTLSLAPSSLDSIFATVRGTQGAGLAHLLVEHVTLQWPGGLAGLRLPSLVFLLLALPAAGLVARELFGRREELIVVCALAVSPLVVAHATEGRPAMLLLAVFLWSLGAALRAARLGGRERWAIAGLGLGALAFVQPIAPLYACLVLATALVHARGGLRRIAGEAWPAALLLGLALIPYSAAGLHALRARYEAYQGTAAARSAVGNTVVHAAFDSLAPGAVGFTVLALAGIGLVALFAERLRTGLALTLLIGVPIAFFGNVPPGGRSAAYLDRYMIPALPVFLLLAAVGCERVGRVARRGTLAVAAAAAVLFAAEIVPSVDALADMHALDLPQVAAAVGSDQHTVLFGSTGTYAASGTDDALTRSRPPSLVATYVALARPDVEVVNESTCAGVKGFLAERAVRPRRGVWVFYEPVPALADAAAGRLATVAGVRVELVGDDYAVVRSRRAGDPRDLVALGVRLRRAWRHWAPEDNEGTRLLAADREGIDATWNCLLPENLIAQALAPRMP